MFTHDLCTYLMQCGGARYRDAAHCERELTCYGLPELTAAAKRGAVDYDASKVGACHERFQQSPCSFASFVFTPDIYHVLGNCPGTVTPKLKAGDSCSANGECSAGLYCNKGTSYTCPGTCKAFSQKGESCSDGAHCADGLRCDSSHQCVPLDVVGTSCTDSCNPSYACPLDQGCPTDVWCDKAAGKCQASRLEGEPCGVSGTSGTSTMASRAACAANLWCDAPAFGAGTCRKTSAPGGPCNYAGWACQQGLHCVGYDALSNPETLGTCQPPGPLGSECRSRLDCNEGLNCNAGSCQPPRAAAAACNEDLECQAGLVCLENQCTVARYPGDSCTAGPCSYSRCVNGTCDDYVKVGEACVDPTDCATGRCVAGRCYDASLCQAPM